MQAYISSKSNQTLLHNYAFKMLLPEWPLQRAALKNAIDACIDTSSDLGPFYSSWSVTKENIATVNVEIWKSLKAAVTSAMNGAIVERPFIERPERSERPEDGSDTYKSADSSEAPERQNVHKDLYNNQWN